MTKLLTRIFIKDYENSDDLNVRAKCGKLAGVVGIICNAILFAAKLLIGTLSGSVSITADAINNLSDASSSLVTLIGFKLASKPADKKHPYGYSRIEYFSGLAVSLLILVIGIELVKSSVTKILHPEPVEFSAALVIVLVLSILVKLWMMSFNNKLGRHINSSALTATAADSRNDVISTAAVLAACIIAKVFSINIDGYIGLLVALFILWSGIGIAKETISPLLGECPDESLVHSISEYVIGDDIVMGIHDLIIHDYGPGRRFASAHVEVDRRLDPLIAHEHIDNIERDVKRKHNTELVLHYDPVVVDDEEANGIKEYITDVLTKIDDRIAIHDFRMVKGEGHSNVIFDMVLPFDLCKKTSEIEKILCKNLDKLQKKYYPVITYDDGSFNDAHFRS